MTRYPANVQVRWVDLDAQQHVNNALFADYLETARAQWLTDGPAEPLLREGAIVVRHEIEYLASMPYSSEPLRVEVGVVKMGGARFVLDYELIHAGRRVAHARSVMCPFDFATQSPRRLTEIEREYLSAFRVEAERPRPLKAVALAGQGTRYPLWTRWSDADQYGHVNNVRYFDYVQEARIALTMGVSDLMARAGTPNFDALPEDQRGAYRWVLARQDVYYLTQMAFRTAPHAVLTAPTKLGESSVTFTAEVIDPLAGDEVLARAVTIQVCTNASGSPTALPEEVRARLSELLPSR